MNKHLAVALLGVAPIACATTHTTPPELSAARQAYEHAAAVPGADLVAVEVYRAKKSLLGAEEAWASDKLRPHAPDLSYVAQRQADIAAVLAETKLAEQQRDEAEQAITLAYAAAAGHGGHPAGASDAQATAQAPAAPSHPTLVSMQSRDGRKVEVQERGVVVTLAENALFAPGEAELIADAQTHLAEVIGALDPESVHLISVDAYTDTAGSKDRNDALTQQRADSVMQFLSANGLSNTEIRATGHGSKGAIADNASPDGRSANRRVEIVVHAKPQS